MARHVRLDYPGAIHHVYGRGNGKLPIFRDEQDMDFFLRKFQDLKLEMGFEVLSDCLMTNHYHFAIETGSRPLAKVMHRALTAYARYFNDKWLTVGHPFQGRYGSRLIRDDSDLRAVVRYIHMNPVDAGLCGAPSEWSWSSHRGLLRGHDRLANVERARALFGPPDAWETEYRRQLVEPRSPAQRALERIAEDFATMEELRGPSRSHELSALRARFVQAAVAEGYRCSEVARFLNRTPAAIGRLLNK